MQALDEPYQRQRTMALWLLVDLATRPALQQLSTHASQMGIDPQLQHPR